MEMITTMKNNTRLRKVIPWCSVDIYSCCGGDDEGGTFFFATPVTYYSTIFFLVIVVIISMHTRQAVLLYVQRACPSLHCFIYFT